MVSVMTDLYVHISLMFPLKSFTDPVGSVHEHEAELLLSLVVFVS